MRRRRSLGGSGRLVALLAGGLLSLAAAGAGLSRLPEAAPEAGSAWPPDATPDATRQLVGDWEPADAFLVAYQHLWHETLWQLADVLAPRPVYLLAASPGAAELPGRSGTQRLRNGPDPDGSGFIPLGLSHQSAWVRDYGPIQVRHRGGMTWLDADYYAGRIEDDAVPARLARRFGMRAERVPYRLEGGGIASSGTGLCVMTRASFERLGTSGTRPSGRERTSDRRDVAERLGCARLVVVPALDGEPTGHVDMIVHFLRPDVVAVGALTVAVSGAPHVDGPDIDGSDLDARRLDAAARLLRTAALEAGLRLEVVRVPMYRGADASLFSYLNVIHTEDSVVVPDFRAVPPSIQTEAHRVLGSASGKRVVAVAADNVGLVGGGLHCIVLGLHFR